MGGGGRHSDKVSGGGGGRHPDQVSGGGGEGVDILTKSQVGGERG